MSDTNTPAVVGSNEVFGPEQWLAMQDAPLDGTLVRLLVKFDHNAIEASRVVADGAERWRSAARPLTGGAYWTCLGGSAGSTCSASGAEAKGT